MTYAFDKPVLPQSGWRYLASLTIMVIAYLFLALLSGEVFSPTPNLFIVWLPSGMTLAVVLLGGSRYLVGIFISIIGVSAINEFPLSTALLLGISNTTTVFIATYLLTSVMRLDLTIGNLKALMRVITVGGFISMFIGAIPATVVGFAQNDLTYTAPAFFLQFFTVWLGAALAVTFITPCILIWAADQTPLHEGRDALERVILIGVALLLNLVGFANILQVSEFYIFYFIAPPLIWSIARFRLREVALVNVIMMSFMLWNVQSEVGFIYSLSLVDRFVFIWSTLGVGTVLVLGSKMLLDERNEIVLTLRKERDAMTQILNNLGQGVTVVNKDGLYEYINPAFGDLIGHDPESLVGTSPYEYIADSFKPELDEVFKLRQTGESSTYRVVLQHNDGREIVVMATGVARTIDGEYHGSISVLTDVSPLLEAQEAQRRSESEFRTLFENTRVGMYRCNPDGKTVAVNRSLANLLGFESSRELMTEYADKSMEFYVHPKRYTAFLEDLRRDGEVADFESEVYHLKTRQKFWVTENAYAVYDDDGEMLYYEGTVLDITIRKRFEQELQRSESFFRTLFAQSADGIAVTDTTGRIIMSNPVHQNLTGYSSYELSQMTINDYVHPDDIDRIETVFNKAVKNHQSSYTIDLRYNRPDGSIRWISTSIGLVWNEQNECEYAISISRDVTEARQLQASIKEDEKRFRAVFENASLPIVVTRQDRNIGMVNRAFSNMLGYSADELQETQFDDITYPGDNDENLSLHQQLVDGAIDHFTVTKRYVHKNGSTVWANVSVSRFDAPVPDTDGDDLYTIAIIENITDRKLAEDRLFAEINLTDQLLDALPGVFYFFDQEGQFLRWNRELENISGLSPEEILIANPIDFFPPESKDDVMEAIQEAFEDGYAVRELPILKHDGTHVQHLMNGYRLEYNGKACLLGVGIDINDLKEKEIALRESEERYRTIFENALVGMYRTNAQGHITSANPALAEILGYDSVEELYALDLAQDVYTDVDEREKQMIFATNEESMYSEHIIELKKKNGEIITAGIRSRAYLDDVGNLLYFEGNLRDVTAKYRYEQKLEERVIQATRELRKKNEQLLELDRLRSKFIADMSHEMRTPLTVLHTRLYLLRNSKDTSNLTRHIDGLQMQIDRLSEFVENAFDLSVIDMSQNNIAFVNLSFNELIDHAIQALQPRADLAGLKIINNLDDTIPNIWGVESHLSQVVTNLVGNAIKYTQEGHITITTGQDSITKRVYLRVEDTGMGIAPEDKPYLFTRFYRGERAGQSTIPGTGLGLSIVKEIIDAHDGHLDVESNVDEGSIFTVWLPLGDKPSTTVQDDASATNGE